MNYQLAPSWNGDELNHLFLGLESRMRVAAHAKLEKHGYYGIYPCAEAPSTLAALQDCYEKRPYGKLLPVYNGACDNTIYSTPQANFLARAWHDLIHIELNADFVLADELKVSETQCSEIDGIYATIIAFDIAGQSECMERIGKFPENQREFVSDCMRLGLDAAIENAR